LSAPIYSDYLKKKDQTNKNCGLLCFIVS